MNNPHYKSGMWNYELSLWNSDCRNHLGNFLLVPQDVRFYHRDLIQLNKYSSSNLYTGRGGGGVYYVRNKLHVLLRANFVYMSLLFCTQSYFVYCTAPGPVLYLMYCTWSCIVYTVLYLVLYVCTLLYLVLYYVYCTVTGHVLCVLYCILSWSICTELYLVLYCLYCTVPGPVLCVLYCTWSCTMCTVPGFVLCVLYFTWSFTMCTILNLVFYCV